MRAVRESQVRSRCGAADVEPVGSGKISGSRLAAHSAAVTGSPILIRPMSSRAYRGMDSSCGPHHRISSSTAARAEGRGACHTVATV